MAKWMMPVACALVLTACSMGGQNESETSGASTGATTSSQGALPGYPTGTSSGASDMGATGTSGGTGSMESSSSGGASDGMVEHGASGSQQTQGQTGAWPKYPSGQEGSTGSQSR